MSLRATYLVEGMSCASCARTVEAAVKQSTDNAAVDPLSGRTVALVPDRDTAEKIEGQISETGFPATLIELLPIAAPPIFTVTTAIGGMSCSGCAHTIRALCEDLDFVESAAIDALAGTATFRITQESKEPLLAETITSAGYEYTLVSLTCEKNVQQHTRTRTVTLEIRGMHCERCPSNVMETLRSYGDAVEIQDSVSLEHPTLSFTYIPLPPKFGIRAIVDEIESNTGLSCIAVEPKSPEQIAQENREREMTDISRRFLVALVFAIPTTILMFSPMLMMSHRGKLLMFFLSSPVYFYSAAIFHKHALATTRFKGFFHFGSMNLLMSLGTTISYAASIVILLVDPTADTYFDSVVYLTLFLLCGRYLDVYSKAKTATAVSSLSSLRPDEILVRTGDNESESYLSVPLWKVDIGDVVKVPPGAKVGVDGIVIEGSTQVDEATLTGESVPLNKTKGELVYSGTLNIGTESLVVRAKAVDKGTLLDGIVDVVRQGQLVRANLERFSDGITEVFVPIVVYLALIVWAAWYAAGKAGYVPRSELTKCHCGWFFFAMEFAVSVFVVACPCGVGLAAPTALYVGGGVAAKHGIISRGGGEAFEQGASIDIVCFDKTGTLTSSKPVITNFHLPSVLVPEEGHDHYELTQLAARIEEESTHPLATAIKEYAADQPVRPSRVENIRSLAGRGLKANICAGPYKGKEAIFGNERLVSEQNIRFGEIEMALLRLWKSKGKSVMILCVDFQIVALFAANDTIRPEAKQTVAKLREHNVDSWMISGDNLQTARAVAAKVGIPVTNVIAEVLPEQKAEKIKWLQQTGMSTSRSDGRSIVAMVGDGINDAPALTVADVGIAMGSGADITLNTAKFVLVHSNLSGVALMIDLSKAVMRKVKLNYFWAALYNIVAVPVAAGLLYPWTGQRLDPVIASLAMCLSSLSVMANSLLLKLYEPPKSATS